ncbi:MAG: penicillin-binding transpeptidase domain-containing protein [Defluviitaleaceae bacterium]|nr:penicillin-binding transpeptidase domain-containing protein [Defluviitaleaceae bacterium]
MSELIMDAIKASWRVINHRILWLFVAIAILFYVMFAQLYELQIILSHTFVASLPITATVEQTIPATRGNIYDRLGRPLAINIPVWVATIDPSIIISNEALLELTRLFERNNEDFENTFPMTTEWPYEFILGGSTPGTRELREFRWKDDMAVPNPETATAAESFLYLRDWFGIDPDMSNEDARRILNFRSMVFYRRFRPHPFVVAIDISHYTIATIEEQSTFFSGVKIELRTLRVYPQGRYFSHILGYVGVINAEELAANPDYTHDDIIGKIGLERSMEAHLRGVQGTQVIEINPNTGRRVGSPPEVVPPLPGSNIFLTLDVDMQIQTYYILKDYLTEIAIRRVQGGSGAREPQVTYQHVFNNLIRAGWIPIRDILETEEDNAASILRRYVLERFPEATVSRDDRAIIVNILTAGIDSGRITPAMMFTAMVDLGILSDYEDFTARVQAGRFSASSFIAEKLRMGELTPQMVNIDPATGSIVVLDVNTGAVLAAVAYPSYDNNRLVNRIDTDYFFRINSYDHTHPMINRPFIEARAPGSTFKMITAAAGLDTGVISPSTTIRDNVVFTRAGRPAARCMSSRGHGSINVTQAIATSCNYFFFETAFRLGNNQRQRIDVLNTYMEFFGLNERTGVEIGELADNFNRERTANIMASPELKEFVHLSRNALAPSSEWDWFDGDTIRTAIGQSYNNYTSAMMARYIMQIANNGVRLPLHLVGSIRTGQGEIVYLATPMPCETGMELADSTWVAIQQGMLQATEGWGTATNHFRDFPIQVAGKTGTAEQVGSRLSHTSFGAYAPFDNPQIAIYVTIPFGATSVMPAASTQVARDVIYAFLVQPRNTVEQPMEIDTLLP